MAAMDGSGRLSRANHQFRSLVGLPPEPVGPEALGDRLDEGTCRELRKLARSLSSSRDTSGALEVRLPWGRTQALEFHARRLPAAHGGYSLELRSLEERDSTLTQAAMTAGLGSASTLERERLLNRARRRRLDPGEGLGLAGHRPWAALVVLGIVRLFARADGVEPTLAYAGPGALVGSHLVRADDSTPIELQALAPSVVIQLPPNRIRDLIRVEGPFASAVVDHAQAFVGSTVATLAARTGTNLSQRLAREIALLSDLFPAGGLLPVTEQQLADGIGSIRESVARTLGRFRRDGWVATTRHGLLVLDAGAVRRAAGTNAATESSMVLGREAAATTFGRQPVD
jgi:CRP-like cAMP-binding protein